MIRHTTKQSFAIGILLSVMTGILPGCKRKEPPHPATKNIPSQTTQTHQSKTVSRSELKAWSLLAEGDIAGSLIQLNQAVTSEHPMPDPAALLGGFANAIHLPSDDSPYTKTVQKGLKLATSGKLSKARIALIEAVSGEGFDRPEGFFLMGLLFLRDGQANAALGALSKARHNDKSNMLIRLTEAVALERLGHSQRASGIYDRIAELGGADPRMLSYYQAYHALIAGDKKQAARALGSVNQTSVPAQP